jgi:hypothetical protein
MTIHKQIESPCRVDKKNTVFKNVYSDFWLTVIFARESKYIPDFLLEKLVSGKDL